MSPSALRTKLARGDCRCHDHGTRQRLGFSSCSSHPGSRLRMAFEKRSSVRRDARYGVWIAYGDDRTLVPCTLLDVSQSGARLMLPGNEDVPDDFMLLLSEQSGRG